MNPAGPETSSSLVRVKRHFRLFKQPNKVGEVLNDYDGPLLIIGIEKYELFGNTITIWYTCQKNNGVSNNRSGNYRYGISEPEFELEVKYDDHQLKAYTLGSTFSCKGDIYKITEYTEISLKGSDIYLSFLARP
ncbi:hypothetical protein, partial [Peribacillus sp. NPDC056705]|uniref:hypothetical protein n=1 Tax=Peribacillus sp. NPDC056705 TaxID=3345918 RepID=UPI0037496D85